MNYTIKKRESNFELLRILCILGVIILHINSAGALNYAKTNNLVAYYFLIFLEVFNCVAVDVFILISGYFLIENKNIKKTKIIKLIFEVIIINFIFECAKSFLLGKRFSILVLLPTNYFVIFYLVLYIISPYINLMVNNVKNRKRLFVISFSLFSIYPTLIDIIQKYLNNCGYYLTDLSSITRHGSMYGYTIVNFVLLYIIGASLKDYNGKNLNKFKLLFCGFICLLVQFFSLVFEFKNFIDVEKSITLSYCNPIVILQAIVFFMIIMNLKINHNKIINNSAKSVFCVYLVHPQILSLFIIYDRLNKNSFICIVYTIAASITLYLIGFIFYKVISILEKIFLILKDKITYANS